MASQSPEPADVQAAHPYPPYAELQAENARLRDQLDKAQTILTAVGSQVDLWREWSDDGDVIERQGPPRGRWADDGDGS